ncbi:hypothetical protein [Caballeronia sordidicola]|uniref:hypothetical protein n=1 Tax=Caballeronia sordidicola TaxID=196367 RepID=UPI001F1B08C7|nr:hypothetical protein [Caballeronia sordidicola]
MSKIADWRTVGMVREAAWLAWGVESGKRALAASANASPEHRTSKSTRAFEAVKATAS